MLTNIKKLFWISRPVSWPNTAFPFAAGYIVTGGTNLALLAIGTLYFLIPYNLLMYGINDVFDYESDIKNPRKGGIEGMREQRAFHPTIVYAAIISNTICISWLLLNSSLTSGLVLLLVIFLVIAYSVAGLRFKERPILDSATSSLHFVGPLIYAAVLTQSLAAILWFVIAFFIWGMASHAFGAVQDIIPDRKASIHSIATYFGAQNTVRFSFVMYLLVAIILATQGLSSAVLGVVSILYAVNVAPYLNVTDVTSGITNKAWKRFIWLNLFTGFCVTIALILAEL